MINCASGLKPRSKVNPCHDKINCVHKGTWKARKMGSLERLNVMRTNVWFLGTKCMISRQGEKVWWFEWDVWDVPHSLGYLNTWSPVGCTVWGGLGRCGFAGGDFESLKTCTTLSLLSLLRACGWKFENSARCNSHHACLLPHFPTKIDSYPFETISQANTFFYMLTWS